MASVTFTYRFDITADRAHAIVADNDFDALTGELTARTYGHSELGNLISRHRLHGIYSDDNNAIHIAFASAERATISLTYRFNISEATARAIAADGELDADTGELTARFYGHSDLGEFVSGHRMPAIYSTDAHSIVIEFDGDDSAAEIANTQLAEWERALLAPVTAEIADLGTASVDAARSEISEWEAQFIADGIAGRFDVDPVTSKTTIALDGAIAEYGWTDVNRNYGTEIAAWSMHRGPVEITVWFTKAGNISQAHRYIPGSDTDYLFSGDKGKRATVLGWLASSPTEIVGGERNPFSVGQRVAHVDNVTYSEASAEHGTVTAVHGPKHATIAWDDSTGRLRWAAFREIGFLVPLADATGRQFDTATGEPVHDLTDCGYTAGCSGCTPIAEDVADAAPIAEATEIAAAPIASAAELTTEALRAEAIDNGFEIISVIDATCFTAECITSDGERIVITPRVFGDGDVSVIRSHTSREITTAESVAAMLYSDGDRAAQPSAADRADEDLHNQAQRTGALATAQRRAEPISEIGDAVYVPFRNRTGRAVRATDTHVQVLWDDNLYGRRTWHRRAPMVRDDSGRIAVFNI